MNTFIPQLFFFFDSGCKKKIKTISDDFIDKYTVISIINVKYNVIPAEAYDVIMTSH